MIIPCPECGSKFEVPDDALGDKGRKVKCSSCAHVWVATPDTAVIDSAPEPKTEPEPEPETKPELTPTEEDIPTPLKKAQPSGEALRARSRKKGKNIKKDKTRSKKRAFAAIIAILLGAITFTILFAKDKIISFAPESTLFYESIGAEELPLRERVEITFPEDGIGWVEGEINTLSIEGEIKNITSEPIILPNILITQTKEDTIINTWSFPLEQPNLPANGTINFHHIIQDFEAQDGQIGVGFDLTETIMDEETLHTEHSHEAETTEENHPDTSHNNGH